MIHDYRSKMERLCGGSLPKEEDPLFTFEEWASRLSSNTFEEISRIAAQHAVSKAPNNALVTSLLNGLAIYGRERMLFSKYAFDGDRVKNKEQFYTTCKTDHVGYLYMALLRLFDGKPRPVDGWLELLELRVQYQKKMVSVFERVNQELRPPPTVLETPLPFLDVDIPFQNSTLVEAFIMTQCTK
jgi:hypothetical protein